MKIYLKYYTVSDIMKRISSFDKYHIGTNHYYEIFTEEGIFQVTNNAIFKMNTVDAKIMNVKRADGHELIIDKTTINPTNYHQIPSYHIVSPVSSFIYQTRRGGPKLVIEGKYGSQNFSYVNNDKYLGFAPSNFYFDVNSETDDINVFLSQLN